MNSDFTFAIDLPIDDIKSFCDRLPIDKLAIFGSVLRDDFSDNSDVDMLIKYTDSAKISLIDMATQEYQLGNIIGRKVDLRTAQELSQYFRDDVLAMAITIYERQ